MIYARHQNATLQALREWYIAAENIEELQFRCFHYAKASDALRTDGWIPSREGPGLPPWTADAEWLAAAPPTAEGKHGDGNNAAAGGIGPAAPGLSHENSCTTPGVARTTEARSTADCTEQRWRPTDAEVVQTLLWALIGLQCPPDPRGVLWELRNPRWPLEGPLEPAERPEACGVVC